MYPFLRLWRIFREARRLPKAADPGEIGEITIRIWPWDIDPFMELNNGRTLTLMDLGRFSSGARIGLMEVLRRRKWGLAVAGASVRWRKRVTVFQKATIRSRLVGWEGRWFYITQSMWVNGQPVSSALLRTAVTSKNGAVEGPEVLKELGFPSWQPEMPAWVRAWIEAEELRPWPPEEMSPELPGTSPGDADARAA